LSSASAFTAAATECGPQFVLRQFSVFVLIEFGESFGSVLDLGSRDHVIAIGVEGHHDWIRRRPESSSAFSAASTFALSPTLAAASAFAATPTFTTAAAFTITASFAVSAASLTVARTISATWRLSNNSRADHCGHGQNHQSNTEFFHRN
jgi:hypothetical protein